MTATSQSNNALFDQWRTHRLDALEVAMREIANTPVDSPNFAAHVLAIANGALPDTSEIQATPFPALQGAREWLRWALNVISETLGMADDDSFDKYVDNMRLAFRAMDTAYSAQEKVDMVRIFLEQIDDCGEPYAGRDKALEAIRHV